MPDWDRDDDERRIRVEYDPECVANDVAPREEHVAALVAELRRASVCVLPGVSTPHEVADVPEAAALDSAYAIWVSMAQAANSTQGAMALYVPDFAVILRHMALMAAGQGDDQVVLRVSALTRQGYEVRLTRCTFPTVGVAIYPRRSGAVSRAVNIDAMLRDGAAPRDAIMTAFALNATPDDEFRRVASGEKN